MSSIKRVCVFCGSRHGSKPGYTESARGLATALVKHNIGLVYGGQLHGLLAQSRPMLGPSTAACVPPSAFAGSRLSKCSALTAHKRAPLPQAALSV